MKKIRNNRGVTLVSLAVTIVVMMILTVSLTASMTSTIELKKYNQVKEDIIALTEEVKVYYMKNLSLPAYTEKTIDIPNIVDKKDRNPNDSGNYYPINIGILSDDLVLNLGEGNTTKNFETDDLYVVNEESLTVYYLQGAVLNGQKHYTIVDDFSGTSFAEEYYSKVDLPIISVVTMESNGKNKMSAGIGDTVTLKMLSNYELTTFPTVTINNENVTVTWNGKVGTATYTLPETYDTTLYNTKIPFSISNYSADNRTGEDISDVTFGQGVYSYAKSFLELYKIGVIKIGDYVNYTYDKTDKDGKALTYSLPTTQSGYTNSNTEDGSQTISQSSETLQWRILNVDETTGNVDLVSATPTDNTVTFQGALGYNNGVYLLNDICAKLYSNSSKGITARSINLEDTEKHLTTAGLNKRNNFTYTSGDFSSKYGETKTYTDNQSYYPNLYAYEIGSGVNVTSENASSITQPDATIENPDPYKESMNSPSSSFTVPTTATTEDASKNQASNSVLTVTQTYYGGSDISFNTTNYGEAGDVLKADNYYWVASRYADCFSSYAYLSLRRASTYMYHYGSLFYSNGGTDNGYYCLRPVVSLKSNDIDTSLGKNSDGAWQIRTK